MKSCCESSFILEHKANSKQLKIQISISTTKDRLGLFPININFQRCISCDHCEQFPPVFFVVFTVTSKRDALYPISKVPVIVLLEGYLYKIIIHLSELFQRSGQLESIMVCSNDKSYTSNLKRME